MKDPNVDVEKIEKAAIKIQSCYRGYKVRLQYKEFFRKIKYRKFIIKEIISIEKQYIDKISAILENVKKPLLADIHKYKDLITVDQVNTMFSNLDEIVNLHCNIYKMFSNFSVIRIGHIYLEMLPKFIIYLDYVKNYNLAFRVYAKIESRIDFSSFLEGLYLPSYLISPIQQTPRYVLLFSDLLKNTNLQNEDYGNLQQLVELARKTATEINAAITASPQDLSDEDNSDSESVDEEVMKTVKTRSFSANSKVQGPFKRPASASSKHKPRNSIIMHKNAIDKVLSDNENNISTTPYSSQDFSNLPSYLRPTLASMGWSRNKAEMSPSAKPPLKVSTNSHDKIDKHYVYNYASPPSSTPSDIFIDRSTPKNNKPDWKHPKTSKENDPFKSTKKQRPTSPPPPKINFYSPHLTPLKTNSNPDLLSKSTQTPTRSQSPINNNISSHKPPMFNLNSSSEVKKIEKKSNSSNSLLTISSNTNTNNIDSDNITNEENRSKSPISVVISS